MRVLEVCRQKKITQKELAAKISMSPVGLSKAVNGNPTKETLEKIASALEVSVTELFEKPNSCVFECPKCKTTLVVREN